MSADLVSYLATKGVRTFRAAGPEITAHCWWCSDGNAKGKGKLYLNSESWAYHCKRCGNSGGQHALMEHYGDQPEAREYLPGTDPAARRKVLAAATDLGADWLLANPAVLTYLTGRGLSEATIIEARLGYAPSSWGLGRELRVGEHAFADIKAAGLVTPEGQEFFSGHILIPYLSHGQPVQLRGRAYVAGKHLEGAKYVTPGGDNVRLFNSDALHGASQAIVVEGELDALILQQALARSDEPKLRTTAVVAVAGAGAFPDLFVSYFETCRRVYIGFDPDGAGRAGAEKAVTQLGTKARTLRLPEDLPACDWTDYLAPAGSGIHAGHTWRDVAALIDAADSVGRTLYTPMDALAQWQRISREIGGILTGIEGLDRYIAPGLKPGQLMIPLARTGVGKGHPLDTEVPTPYGWCRWGDLEVGDEVFGSDGAPTQVLAIHDRGVLPVYRVHFGDGSSVQADPDHIWSLKERGGHLQDWSRTREITTAELAQADPSADVPADGRRRGYRWHLPMAGPLQYPAADLPVEPYTLGALIANGSLVGHSAILSTPDPEVIARVRASYDVPAWDAARAQAGGYCPHGTVRGVIGICRSMGMAVKSRNKFIPRPYLTACIEQRVALLQGLMDCDGCVRPGRRSVVYSTTSPRLAEDLRELVTSLGGTARIFTLARGGEISVGIMLPEGIEPFSTTRKQAGSTIRRTVPTRALVRVEAVEEQEIRCIQVAAPDQLYLIGRDHVVTHNSAFLASLSYNLRDRPQLIMSLELTAPEYWDRLMRIGRFYNPLATDEEVARSFSKTRIFDRRIKPGDLLRLSDEFAEDVGEPPQVIALDYIGYASGAYQGSSQYERTTRAVMALKEDAKAIGAAMIAPHQAGRTAAGGAPVRAEDARDSGAIEDTADILLGLFNPSDADVHAGYTGQVNCTILKNRNGRKNVGVPLLFSLMSLVMVEKASPSGLIVEDENRLILSGETYVKALEYRRANARKSAWKQPSLGSTV